MALWASHEKPLHKSHGQKTPPLYQGWVFYYLLAGHQKITHEENCPIIISWKKKWVKEHYLVQLKINGFIIWLCISLNWIQQQVNTNKTCNNCIKNLEIKVMKWSTNGSKENKLYIFVTLVIT